MLKEGRHTQGSFSLVWGLLLILALGSTLAPLDGNGRIDFSRWADAPSTYFTTLPAHVYQLIKTLILWAPVGFLYTLAVDARVIKAWAPWGILVLLAVGMFTLPSPGFRIALDALMAIPGLALGIWLASRTKDTLPAFISSTLPAEQKTRASQQTDDEPKQRVVDVNPLVLAKSGLVGRVAGLLLIAGVVVSLFQFPLFQWGLAIVLGLYVVLMWRFPSVWMVIVPAALSLFDLAPWTGRFFWDEFDLLMLVTLAVALWQGQFRLSAWKVPQLGGLLGLFVLVWGVSLLLGLLPLQPLDANAFSAYWSHYNSLRLAKGLLWGLVFYGLYRSQPDDAGAFIKLSIGMALGVLGVSLWALWEHALFVGAETTTDYRATAGFSSMHVGGGHIEAYLVIALPFVWGLFFLLRNPIYRALLGGVFMLGTSAMLFTVARGGVIALAVALLILIPGTWWARRNQSGQRAGFATPWVMGVLALVVMVAGVSGAFWTQRLEQTGTDAGIRFHHWADVLSLRDSGVMTALFGQGLGSLPEANLLSQLPDQAGSYRHVSEGGNTWLALNSAGTLYMAQRVAPHPAETLRLEVSVRARSPQAGLEASLCEKILFDSRKCQWLGVDVKKGGHEWQRLTQTFNSGEVGAGNFLTSRPVQFSLYNPTPGSVIEVDNVHLLDQRGQDLLKNGDFSKGGDFWFFKSGNHLFWHAKNIWVHMLFEQGWLGVTLFTLILILALVRLARTVTRGEIEATVLLASVGAWIIVGGVDSLVDAPRLAQLVYGTLLMGAAWGSVPLAQVKHARRRRRHAHSMDKVIEP